MSGPEFFSIPCSIARIPQAELSFGAKCLYGRLDLYGRKTGKRNPSQKTLAKELGVSDRHIRNLLDELQNCGLLSWVRARGSASYTFNPPEAFEAPERNGGSYLKRNHTSGPERKGSSDQTGTSVPTTRCSSKDHHQKRRAEKKQHEHAKESEPNPTFESDDEKTRTPLANPEMEFRERMAERHGAGG